MADALFPTADDADGLDDPGLDQGAEGTEDGLSGDATPPGATEEQFFDPAHLSPELREQHRRMQASFTKRMQSLRAKEKDLGPKAAMVDRFNTDPAYARQVIEQIAPRLGLALAPTAGTPGPQGTPSAPTTSLDGITQLLTSKLGPDLAFLAPALAPAILETSQAMTRAAIAPLEQRVVGQSEASRRAEEDRLMGELDASMPGWEEQYGDQMRELDAYLASDALTHPTFGNKYELYLRLLNPSIPRREAVRDIGRAARNRVGTGRAGTQAAPNVSETIRKAHQQGGWNAAWEAAIKNVDALMQQ